MEAIKEKMWGSDIDSNIRYQQRYNKYDIKYDMIWYDMMSPISINVACSGLSQTRKLPRNYDYQPRNLDFRVWGFIMLMIYSFAILILGRDQTCDSFGVGLGGRRSLELEFKNRQSDELTRSRFEDSKTLPCPEMANSQSIFAFRERFWFFPDHSRFFSEFIEKSRANSKHDQKCCMYFLKCMMPKSWTKNHESSRKPALGDKIPKWFTKQN